MPPATRPRGDHRLPGLDGLKGICIILVVVAGFFISRGYEEILFPKLRD